MNEYSNDLEVQRAVALLRDAEEAWRKLPDKLGWRLDTDFRQTVHAVSFGLDLLNERVSDEVFHRCDVR